MSKKRLAHFAMIGALTATSVTPAVVAAETDTSLFNDLKPGQSHFDTVKALNEAGIINGYPDGTFKPNLELNKKQTAALFVKALRLDLVDSVESLPFDDVKLDSPLARQLSTLIEAGVIEADSNTYNAGDILTREEMAGWLANAFDLKPINNKSITIKDFTEIDSQYRNNVMALFHHEITKGLPDGSFNPKGGVKRGQFASFLYNTLTANTIERLQSISELNVEINEDVNLPTTVNALLTNGSLQEVPVTWEDIDFSTEEAGTYQVTGYIQGTLLSIDVTVNVTETVIEEVFKPEPITIEVDQELVIPDSLEALTDSGKKRMVDVLWEDKIIDTSQPGEYTLNGLVYQNEEKIELQIIVEPNALEVEEVKSINLKQVRVNMNRIIEDKTAFENLHMYQLVNEFNQEISLANVEVNGDMITLTTVEVMEQKPGKLLIKGDDQEYSVFFRDMQPPSLTSIEAISPKQLEITFSEPMNLDTQNGNEITNREIKNAFDLDESFNWVTSMYTYNHGQTVVMTFSRELEEDQTLTISEQIRDHFGFKLSENTFEFTVEKDHTSPSITEVNKAYPNLITVTFNKEIELTNDNVAETIESSTGQTATKVAIHDRNKLTVLFDEEQGLQESGSIIIPAGSIEDLWGNENETLNQAITINNDGTEPAISEVALIDANDTISSYIQIEITASEPVKEVILDSEQIAVTDEEGNEIPIKGIEMTDDLSQQKFTITLDKRYGQFKQANYVLHAQALVDLYGNVTEETSFEFEAGSVTKPKDFSGFAISSPNQNEIIFGVNFSRPMATNGRYAVNDLSKYELAVNDNSYILNELKDINGIDVAIHTYEDGTEAEIIIQYEEYANQNALTFIKNLDDLIKADTLEDIQLIVAKVADQHGISTSGFYNPISLDLENDFTLEKAEAIATDTITINLSDEVRFINENDFILYADKDRDEKLDAGEKLPFISNYQVGENETTLTLEIPSTYELNSAGEYLGRTLYITSAEETHTQNKFGQKLDFSQVTVADAIIPQVEVKDELPNVSIHPLKYNDGKAVVKVPFTEDMDARTISRLTFQLESSDYRVVEAYVKNNEALLIVNLNGDLPGDLVGEFIDQLAPISDQNDNLINKLNLEIQTLGTEIYIREYRD